MTEGVKLKVSDGRKNMLKVMYKIPSTPQVKVHYVTFTSCGQIAVLQSMKNNNVVRSQSLIPSPP